jgi:hypothetical protein
MLSWIEQRPPAVSHTLRTLKPEGVLMQISKAKEELPIPAYERRSADVASELREILGMSHLWAVDAKGKRLEPKAPGKHP